MGSEYFSTLEIDAIGEILNISLGASATAVSTLLNSRVDITTPVVTIVSKDEFEMEKAEPAVGVEITYVSGLEGDNVMLLKRHDVKVILELLMGMEMSDEEFELNEINISAVCEVMNQMMGASSTALSEFLGRMVNISTPISFEVKDKQEFIDKYFVDDAPKVVVGFTLKIADKLESEFFNVMPMELVKELVRGFLPDEAIIDLNSVGKGGSEPKKEDPAAAPPVSEAPAQVAPAAESSSGSSGGKLSQEEIEKLLQGGGDSAPEAAPVAPAVPAQPEAAPVAPAVPVQPGAAPVAPAVPVQSAAPVQAAVGSDVAMMQMQMMQQMMQQMQQMQQSQQQMLEESRKPEPKMLNVQPPTRPNLKQNKEIVLQGEQEENMELILGVPLEISVEIGRTRKFVKDILDFTKGSLVVLDKLAGEQVDLYVNGQCIAKGDVVVVEDNFGIRITEIMKINFASLE